MIKFQNTILKIYLNIADCRIQINFHPAENSFFRNKIIKDIAKIYKKFIYSGSDKVNYLIYFYESQHQIFFHDTEKERNNLIKIYSKNKNSVFTNYNISISQFIHILSDILLEYTLDHKDLFVHSSAALINNKACLFIAPSGGGKSTVINFLRNKYMILADDGAFIIKKSGKWYFHQTHFIEKNHWIEKNNLSFPLGKIYFIKKSKIFRIEKIREKNIILPLLIEQVNFTPYNKERQIQQISDFISRFNEFYFLYFALDKEKLTKLVESFR